MDTQIKGFEDCVTFLNKMKMEISRFALILIITIEPNPS